jgi:glycosyltransferase involved in cell wall biosynthesis
MKIAIVSTRGIPNNYGGFEQFAEYISVELVNRGHEVTVYNPHFHPYQLKEFKGVNVVKIFSPEKQLNTAANFIYDYLSLKHAIKNNCDVVLCCGYTTAAIAFKILNFKKTKLITNVDGLEWKRNKYSPLIQKMALYFEKLAVKYSHALVADNVGIKNYLKKNYNADAVFIPYGAEVVTAFDESVLRKYQLTKFQFDVLMARMEPENNIEMILEAYANSKIKIAVVGSTQNGYGKYIHQKFSQHLNIIFLNWIGEKNTLDALRHFARYYIHGHSVGGTNPSLLEAMAARSFIVAHQNEFNQSVLGEDAFYFSPTQLVTIMNDYNKTSGNRNLFVENNLKKIREIYFWKNIADGYEEVFVKVKKV